MTPASDPRTHSEATPSLTFDPADWSELRALGHRIFDEALDHLASVRERPVWQEIPESTHRALRRPLPRSGVGAERAYREFLEHVAPYPLGNTHPRFWGWVIGGGTPVGALAEMIAGLWNTPISGLRNAGVEVEGQVVDWMKEILEYPRAASGILVSGGSMANLLGLAVGLDAFATRNGFDLAEHGLAAAPRRPVLYGSRESHFSVDKSVRLLGLGRSAYRKIAVDERYRVDVDALAAAIRADREAGLDPFLVIGTAGTVNTGACDDLERLADLCAEERLWLHVDGAFGAFARIVPEHAHLVRGLERADSLAFDLHKWLHVPVEAACLLVKDADAHRHAFEMRAAYVTGAERGIARDMMRYANLGPQLTRSFRALKIWMSLSAYGADLHAALVRQNIEQATRLEELIRATPRLELTAPVDLNIVCYRYRGDDGRDETRLDPMNRELLMRLHERGLAAPSSTTLDGKFSIRVSITNHRTRDEDLAFLVEKTLEIGAELEAELAAA